MKNFIYKIQPISLAEKMFFTKNLSIMIESGIALPRSLNVLACQIKHFYFKSAVLQIKKDIEQGSQLNTALSKYPRIFNNFYVSMIKIGEISGTLGNVLNILAKQMKREHKLISNVRGAMIYPSLILTTLIGIAIAMIIFVIPKLLKIFQDMQADLPWNTRLFLAIANNAKTYGLYFTGIILVLAIVFYFYYKKPSGKKIFSQLFLKTPFLGKMSQKINIARFANNLSSLLNSGVSLIDSLQSLKGVLKNKCYSLSIAQISQKIEKGATLNQALEKYPKLYPALLLQMVEIGEETGTTADRLSKLADFYQAEIDETMKNISSIIEPVLMIIIGIAVGFFALSMISPIYSIMQAV